MDTNRLRPLDTPEKIQVYEWAAMVFTMRNKYPKSRLWRMRARQIFRKMEELWKP